MDIIKLSRKTFFHVSRGERKGAAIAKKDTLRTPRFAAHAARNKYNSVCYGYY